MKISGLSPAPITPFDAAKKKHFAHGMASVASSPEEFASFIRNDVAKSVAIINGVGIQPE